MAYQSMLRWFSFPFLSAFALATGCSDETGSGEGSTGTSVTGSASSATGGGTGGSGTGGGGGGGGSSSQSGGGSACHGDSAAWAMATAEPVACEVNADCCVVMNGCINAAQVVAADKVQAAKAAWPYCDNECNDCIGPSVEVECVNKKCVGYRVPHENNPPPELSQDHCGVDKPPLMMMNPSSSFSCGG